MPVRQTLSRHFSAAACARFVKDEGGTMVIFGLMILVMMVAAGGMAVDIMRYEANRVKLQYTLDRAVLAAAALNQDLDPESVVIDYFAKAGLKGYELDVQVVQGVSYRKVTAQSNMPVNSIFLNLVGVDSINAPASGQAIERVLNIEISLVLDISGSMGSTSNASGKTKMTLMKDAAKDFVDTVITPNQANLITMSIIPYNGKVNAGTRINDYFPISAEHASSNCVRFSNLEFLSTGLLNGTVLTRLSHFDKDRGNVAAFNSAYCQTSDYGAILPWSNSTTDLKTKITSLYANGWTAIDVGMKWAALLLDPTTRTIHSNMIVDDHIDDIFEGRPAAYSDHETMKVIVLMTDGSNTNQYDMKAAYKSGLSNVYVWDDAGYVDDDNDGEVEYSVFVPESGFFRYPGDYTNHGAPKGGALATQLTYPQLWARHPVRYVADTIYDSAGHGWSNRIKNAVEQFGGSSNGNARLNDICTVSKAEGVLIFAIGFEAPAGGQSVMKSCASSDSHYYDVNGAEIENAFDDIARTINQLKLTQ